MGTAFWQIWKVTMLFYIKNFHDYLVKTKLCFPWSSLLLKFKSVHKLKCFWRNWEGLSFLHQSSLRTWTIVQIVQCNSKFLQNYLQEYLNPKQSKPTILWPGNLSIVFFKNIIENGFVLHSWYLELSRVWGKCVRYWILFNLNMSNSRYRDNE